MLGCASYVYTYSSWRCRARFVINTWWEWWHVSRVLPGKLTPLHPGLGVPRGTLQLVAQNYNFVCIKYARALCVPQTLARVRFSKCQRAFVDLCEYVWWWWCSCKNPAFVVHFSARVCIVYEVLTCNVKRSCFWQSRGCCDWIAFGAHYVLTSANIKLMFAYNPNIQKIDKCSIAMKTNWRRTRHVVIWCHNSGKNVGRRVAAHRVFVYACVA